MWSLPGDCDLARLMLMEHASGASVAARSFMSFDYKLHSWLAGLLLGVSVASPAQAEPMSLGQEQAVGRALDRHPAVAAAGHSTAGAKWRARQAETAWLPRVALEANYRYQGPLAELVVDTGVVVPGSFDPLVIEQRMGSAHNASAALKVGWRAFDFFARDAQISATRALARAAEAEGDERAAEIAYAVRATYLSALLYDKVEEITRRSLAVAEQALAEEIIRREAGIGDDVAVAGAQTRVAELEARLVDSGQAHKRAMTSLNLFLGVDTGSEIILTDELEVLGGAVGGSAKSAPQLRRLTALGAAVSDKRTGLSRQLWPTIDVFASFGYQYPETIFAAEGFGQAYAVGVALTWNIYDGDLRRRQGKELDARAAELAALRRAAAEDLSRKDADAESRAESAVAAATAARRSLAAAEVYLRAAQSSLAAGTGTTLDVRRAEEAVDKAGLALVRAHFEAALARAQKLRVLGIARGQARSGSKPNSGKDMEARR